jgi:hypothetical protein
MFNQNNEPTNYSTYDSTSSNPYINNNKLNVGMPPYQQQQNMYYFMRQLNPITNVTLSPQHLTQPIYHVIIGLRITTLLVMPGVLIQ